jgi:hypothetical protein
MTDRRNLQVTSEGGARKDIDRRACRVDEQISDRVELSIPEALNLVASLSAGVATPRTPAAGP